MERMSMSLLERISSRSNRILVWIGGIFLIAMIVLTCANIILRLVHKPVSGTYELMGFFGAVVAAFALGYTQIQKGHIAVDVLVQSFSSKVRRGLTGINSLLCFLFSVLCAWQLAKKAGVLWRTGEVTETLQVIYYPFTYAVAFGCALLALVFIADLFKALFEKGSEK